MYARRVVVSDAAEKPLLQGTLARGLVLVGEKKDFFLGT
jgi:hypothetical protein